MRAVIENWLVGTWYDSSQPPWYLRLFEPLYRAAFQRTQKKGQQELARYRSALPLIVVGNITAGGSGKTPLVIRLCQLALAMNLRPGIASTGYGRDSRETLLVRPDSDPVDCGDEPVMLAARTGVPVIVAATRLDAVKTLEEMEIDLIISDDGLQQANLDRDIEFCVIDGKRGLGNGHLIPAGPLREPAERLVKVDYVVTNGVWADIPQDIDVNVMHLKANVLHSLDDKTVLSVDEFRQINAGKDIHTIAAIGHPERFFEMLAGMGLTGSRQGFPDHHAFKPGDFDSLESDCVILMTEKDAVKCRLLGLKNAWYVPVDTHLPGELEASFKEQLTKLMKESG